ncbi:hypothetical protein FPZ43_03550 [Mucilaginibacter pallidiroseus]|uniref:Uncharacterized protein n=1 Tax=Mucilaginibacter pallidiroseus TaxID=2599295 RepID=A0A563UJK1_9SPHI|nr:hypothetical protein [Mucilaginibacter pallidiroseus]TWR31560.1 hypothetical protein FPZ43_03550 [Mucilaginibacter pallidiroseus]
MENKGENAVAGEGNNKQAYEQDVTNAVDANDAGKATGMQQNNGYGNTPLEDENGNDDGVEPAAE